MQYTDGVFGLNRKNIIHIATISIDSNSKKL
jgi:hypothetical protein